MRSLKLTSLTLALTIGLAACAGDDTGSEVEASDDAGATVEVVATDYAFDMPAEVAAGTTLTLRNDSEDEVHEVLAFLIPEDDERSVGDMLAEGEAGMAGLELRGVLLAGPGENAAAGPLGPLQLGEPGRYAVLCFLPTGAPPEEIFAAVDAFVEAGAPEDGAPEYPETGPPHVANGMATELTVTG